MEKRLKGSLLNQVDRIGESVLIQENDRKLETTERNQQTEKSDSRQKRYKRASERGAILLEVIIASLFLLLVMNAGNRLLGVYHLNYQKLFITHQVLLQKQNER